MDIFNEMKYPSIFRYIDFDRLDRNFDDELDGMEACKDAWIEGAAKK